MKRKIGFLILLLQASISLMGQSSYKIYYQASYNGKPVQNQDILIIGNEHESLITTQKALDLTQKFPIQETIIDAQKGRIYNLARLSGNRQIAITDSLSWQKTSFDLSNETKKVDGYWCKKASIVINSNHIDLWYTTELPVKGSPAIAGSPLGLVLEYSRNGNYVLTAIKVEKIKGTNKLNLAQRIQESDLVDNLTYNDLLWKSRYTTIPVFTQARLNFSDETKSNDTLISLRKGIAQIKKLRFPRLAQGDQIFLDVTQRSLGDAYDRTGTVFIVPASKVKLENGILSYIGEDTRLQNQAIASDKYIPNVELMRFFTSFGAGLDKPEGYQIKGKQWHKENFYRQEITDIASLLSDQEIYVGIQIENYDKNGHLVDVNMTIHHDDESQAALPKVLSLFNTVDVLNPKGNELIDLFKSPEGLKMEFTIEKTLKNARIRFITTGHGGWGNGDEFLRKNNSLLLNGEKIFSIVPWREECGSYRMQNPVSGNFSSGLSSSDLSRSNWCPGTITNPYYIDLGTILPGNYTLQLLIPQGEDEGSSYSQWNVSASLIGRE